MKNSQIINVFVVMEITQVIGNKLDCEIIGKFIDTEGRLILLNINIKDNIITLVCLYAPNCKTIVKPNRITVF